jgi:hypothetical protein
MKNYNFTFNRANPNNSMLYILHSKPNNNKTMGQNNRLKVKKLQTKPNVLKTLWKKFKSSINLYTSINNYNKEKIKHLTPTKNKR